MVDWRLGDKPIWTGKYPGRDTGGASWRSGMKRDILTEIRDNNGSVLVGGKNLNSSVMPPSTTGYIGTVITSEEQDAVDAFLDSVIEAGKDPITSKSKFTKDQAMMMIADWIAAKQTAQKNKDQDTLNKLNRTDLAQLFDQLSGTNYFALKNDDTRIDMLVKKV